MSWRAFTATTATQKAASYNAKRQSLSLYNNGSANVFYSQDPTRLDTHGFVLIPGGVATLTKEDGDEPEADLYVLSSAGSVDLRIQEGIVAP